MERQAIVIGLGQFGLAVANALTRRGVGVLAVDVREERVRAAAEFATDAACFDATDEEAMARLSPERRDLCICAIGDEAREASIFCTALLRQMGGPRVIARASDDLHARILTLVGAHQVVNPERDYGIRFASRVLHEGILAQMPLGADLVVSEIEAPQTLIGHPLSELGLSRRYGVSVVAIRRGEQGPVVVPDTSTVLEAVDILVVVGREDAVARMVDAD
jgi:trk system potassium uptake protein TrkA